MTIDSFFIHTLFCFLHNIHLHVILFCFNPDISFLFVFIDEIVKTTDTAEANFIRVIDMQHNPPIFHQQKTTKTIAICLADFIFYIFKWGYLRIWLRYRFLTIKRNTWLHVERNYTTKSNIDWNLYQCNTCEQE